MGIKVSNLNLTYEDGTTLYKESEFVIQKGKRTVILGLNGVGKTTLFKIILNKIKTGAVIENDFENIFYLPQNIRCPKGITVFDYLSTVFFKNGMKWFLSQNEKEMTLEALKTIGLLDKKDIEVDKLSGGEFQKLNLALSLVSKSDLLLLDEPISSLDIINQKFILDTVKGFNKTSVAILHDINLASEWGESFISIVDCKIIQKNKEEFFTPQNLKSVFGAEFEVIKNDEKYFIKIVD